MGDEVNIDEVEELLSAYHTNRTDWKKFAKFDPYKYTRNLVHEGNGKFNLMLLCWAPGNQSSIHDHADAHCFVKNLDGVLKETRYYWPDENSTEDGGVVESGSVHVKPDDVSYMSDELGLHRVENLVTLTQLYPCIYILHPLNLARCLTRELERHFVFR